jgi:chaperonin GroEL
MNIIIILSTMIFIMMFLMVINLLLIVELGIVPGGGVALLWASRQLAEIKLKCENMDQKIGVEIIERACRAPLKTIAYNAGFEGSVIVG